MGDRTCLQYRKKKFVKMSWLFGLNKDGQQGGVQGFEAPQVPTFGESGAYSEEGQASGAVSGGNNAGDAGGPAAVGTVGQDVEGYRSQQYSFDSTALERAAKAAKDLEKSAHATEALALSRVQEETKQKEQEVNIKQYEAQIEQMKIE